MVTLVKTILILKGVDQNWAQVIQGTLIIVVVMIGGLAIRQQEENVSAVSPQIASPAARLRAAQRLLGQPRDRSDFHFHQRSSSSPTSSTAHSRAGVLDTNSRSRRRSSTLRRSASSLPVRRSSC